MFGDVTRQVILYSVLAILSIGGAVFLVFLLGGLFKARSLVRRDFSAYFLSPIGYVVLVVFQPIIGCRFYLTVNKLSATGPHGVEFPMQYMFGIMPQASTVTTEWVVDLLSGVAFWLFFLLIPPLLTMRLFAEERSTGTLETLMTTPLHDWEVVLSKFLACFAFYLVLWLPTLVYLPVLADWQMPVWHSAWTVSSVLMLAGLALVVVSMVLALLPGSDEGRTTALVLFLFGVASAAAFGWDHYRYESEHLLIIPANIDPYPVFSTYLGLVLAGAMLLALGLLISSLVRSQLVAALVATLVNLAFLLIGLLRPNLGLPLQISQDFGRGIVDTRYLVLYSSVAVFALFLTVRSLESRRWR